MNISNKLFSLLGFPEPIDLKRLNNTCALPSSLLYLPLNNACNRLDKAISTLDINLISKPTIEKSIDAMVINATDYQGEDSYLSLYQSIHEQIKYLSTNARIVIVAKSNKFTHKDKDIDLYHEHNAFNQGLIGFTKSLAKEVGRKGSTANIIFIDNDDPTTINQALSGPLAFLLSAKSTFVSGQVVHLQSQLPYSNNTDSSSQKIAVVTGAAQGIGAAIAKKLSNDDYYVIGIDIEPMNELLNKTMRELSGEAFILDISIENAGELLSDLVKKYNGIDLMVHNAGITRDKTLAKMPEHWWKQTIDINLLSVMRINKQLLATDSINKNGRIVCLSSMNGIAGQGGQTNYACSKAGIIGYIKSIHHSLSEREITINAVAPGFIETKMTEQIPFFTREMGRKMNALGQGGLPIDVAEVIAFFAEPESYSVSGQVIRVCGLNMIGA